ncbi:MAG: ligase-associated DNA damage response DEXH box helicase, partial [Planctomycetota bacterium]
MTTQTPGIDPLGPALRGWFESRGWSPYAFQEEAWRAQAAGHSGLIHVPTGAGKTYAAYLASLAEVLEQLTATKPAENSAKKPARTGSKKPARGLKILYVSPLRAVSRDIALALQQPIDDLGLSDRISVETRTGDTSSAVRSRQARTLPTVLVTTPESLTLLLARAECEKLFAGVQTVIVDEWHELLSTKRGTQTELALARIRGIAPNVRTWAMSATLANIEEAASAAAGVGTAPAIVSAEIERPIIIDSVLPAAGDPFPWAGHLGMTMVPRVVESIPVDGQGLPAESTLVFVNTRSQAERWFGGLMLARPAWEAASALHHGSIDRAERERVEGGLKDGSIRLVVATSSLDLGVDFAPVERVMQIGSPKGIARVMQRAGRASHRPGASCRVTCVPTHALEMIEISAVRSAIAAGEIEARSPERSPLDVLSQHMVTRALGGGFEPDALFTEVRTAWSYRGLTREDFDWTLDLVRRGGETLRAYEEYRRVEPDEGGIFRVPAKRVAQMHRLNIGTITGDGVVDIRFVNGRRLGVIEEDFVQQLRAGQKFVFAGRVLQFVRLDDMTALVRASSGRTNLTPIWSGTRLPITESLGEAVRNTLERARGVAAAEAEPEIAAAKPLIDAQSRLSRIPAAGEILCELCKTREGHHLFLYPFDGRLVHGGLAALLALRLSRLRPATFSLASNDYGFELLSPEPIDAAALTPELFDAADLASDAIESVNLSALAKGQFREVARVA